YSAQREAPPQGLARSSRGPPKQSDVSNGLEDTRRSARAWAGWSGRSENIAQHDERADEQQDKVWHLSSLLVPRSRLRLREDRSAGCATLRRFHLFLGPGNDFARIALVGPTLL